MLNTPFQIEKLPSQKCFDGVAGAEFVFTNVYLIGNIVFVVLFQIIFMGEKPWVTKLVVLLGSLYCC